MRTSAPIGPPRSWAALWLRKLGTALPIAREFDHSCAILDAVKPYGAREPSWRVKRDVSLSDRYLVEWVAQAKVGDPFPEPWKWASDPIESIIRSLVELGVI